MRPVTKLCARIHSAGIFKYSVIMSTSAGPGRKAPYSTDLRWRVDWQRLGMELSYREIAKRLCIATSTAREIFKRFERTGEVQPTRQPIRPSTRRLSESEEQLVVAMIMECPTSCLHEVCHEIQQITGSSVSESTVCRVLRRHGFTRKKVRAIVLQRSEYLRAMFMAEVLLYNRDQFVWIDETGCDARNYRRKFGYSLRGTRAESYHLLVRGERISSIAALCSDGVLAVTSTTGSPDLNPVEEAFSSVKGYLKKHDDILQVPSVYPLPIIHAAFQNITKQHCNGWISHSGYC